MDRPDPNLRVTRARERADLARMRFATSLESTKRRLTPDRLKGDARTAASDKFAEIKADAGKAMRDHPVITGSAILAIIAMLFWKPARMVARVGLRVGEIALLNRNLWSARDDKS